MAAIQRFERYRNARKKIRDSDLLLFRRSGVVGRLISSAGRGYHSHAAKAAWWNGHLMCVEVREWAGGRATRLSHQVRDYPRLIDVYQANPGNIWPAYDREAATEYMIGFAGCRYGTWNIAKASLLHLAFIRLAVPADVDDDARSSDPPYCSQACAMSDHWGGGVDPVPNLSDRLVEPTDLARSTFYKYRWTLAA